MTNANEPEVLTDEELDKYDAAAKSFSVDFMLPEHPLHRVVRDWADLYLRASATIAAKDKEIEGLKEELALSQNAANVFREELAKRVRDDRKALEGK